MDGKEGNTMPIFLIVVLIIVILIHYELKKNSKIDKSAAEKFWKREQDANFTRSKDLTKLSFLTIPVSELPFTGTTDPELSEIEQTVIRLSEKKILNLTGISNTDLKFEYGVQNLDFLAEYDQNYTLLVRTLNKWAELLHTRNETKAVKVILEFAVSCKSDVSKTYSLLAEIYASEGNMDKIVQLRNSVEDLNTIMKKTIINELDGYLS